MVRLHLSALFFSKCSFEMFDQNSAHKILFPSAPGIYCRPSFLGCSGYCHRYGAFARLQTHALIAPGMHVYGHFKHKSSASRAKSSGLISCALAPGAIPKLSIASLIFFTGKSCFKLFTRVLRRIEKARRTILE